jgi:hypothetical protein
VIVHWGRNLFRDCVALLSYRSQVVLAVSGPPVRVDLAAPPPLFRGAVNIRSNQLVGARQDFFRIVETPNAETPNAVAIFADGRPMLMAQSIGADEVILHVDLRPIDMDIYDDAAGLHIGESTLANNTFEGSSTAIALG